MGWDLTKTAPELASSGPQSARSKTSLVAAAISLTTLGDIFYHKKPQQGMIHEGMTQMRFDAEGPFRNPKSGASANSATLAVSFRL